jgi:hypothetical protein
MSRARILADYVSSGDELADKAPLASPAFTGTASFSDGNITNVGNIALDTISSDAGTSIGVTLGTDAGDDFNVGSGKLVVEGDTGRCGIGTATPMGALQVVDDGTALPSLGGGQTGLTVTRSDGSIGVTMGFYGATNDSYIQVGNFATGATAFKLLLQPSGGDVEIAGAVNKLSVSQTIAAWSYGATVLSQADMVTNGSYLVITQSTSNQYYASTCVFKISSANVYPSVVLTNSNTTIAADSTNGIRVANNSAGALTFLTSVIRFA